MACPARMASSGGQQAARVCRAAAACLLGRPHGAPPGRPPAPTHTCCRCVPAQPCCRPRRQRSLRPAPPRPGLQVGTGEGARVPSRPGPHLWRRRGRAGRLRRRPGRRAAAAAAGRPHERRRGWHDGRYAGGWPLCRHDGPHEPTDGGGDGLRARWGGRVCVCGCVHVRPRAGRSARAP